MKAKELDLSFIKEKRKAKGYTLKEMADLLGFKSASTYYKYENGDYKMDADMVAKLSIILSVGISKFFN